MYLINISIRRNTDTLIQIYITHLTFFALNTAPKKKISDECVFDVLIQFTF